MSAEIVRAIQQPDIKEGMARDGFVIAPMGPAEYSAFMKTKMQQIRKIAQAASLKVE